MALILQWVQGVFYDFGMLTPIIAHREVFGMGNFRNFISFSDFSNVALHY